MNGLGANEKNAPWAVWPGGNIEDLLGRNGVSLDRQAVSAQLKGNVCLVTGGGGSIGTELCRQIARYRPSRLILVDICENGAYEIQQELQMDYGAEVPVTVRIASIQDYAEMGRLFAACPPRFVFHAAAHKHVPLMEENPEEAVKNNVLGTWNVARLAREHRAERFVLVSTDKAVHPVNIMGAAKRCCERMMQYMSQTSGQTDYAAVRFGNVLGSKGSVLPLFQMQIQKGGPVTVTHPDAVRYFMTLPEAASLILQAGANARNGEIFIRNMGRPVRILTLAEELIRQRGLKPYEDIPIRFTGLRPGEKLAEELLTGGQAAFSEAAPDLYVERQPPVVPEEFEQNLHTLFAAASEGKREELLDALRKLVPDFHPSLPFSCKRER